MIVSNMLNSLLLNSTEIKDILHLWQDLIFIRKITSTLPTNTALKAFHYPLIFFLAVNKKTSWMNQNSIRAENGARIVLTVRCDRHNKVLFFPANEHIFPFFLSEIFPSFFPFLFQAFFYFTLSLRVSSSSFLFWLLSPSTLHFSLHLSIYSICTHCP